jgi:hypothetical protein
MGSKRRVRDLCGWVNSSESSGGRACVLHEETLPLW